MKRNIFIPFSFPIKRLFGLDFIFKGKPFCEGQLKANQFLGKLDYVYRGKPYFTTNK